MKVFSSKRVSDSCSGNPKSKIQNPKWMGFLAVFLVGCVAVAHAQQPAKIPWIGYLARSGSGPAPAFILGLRDLGYVEAKNIGVVFRTAEGRRDRDADLAAELVRLKLDIIVTDNTFAALALKKATSTISIVITNSGDPVGTGLVASFARPGGNVTGLTNISGELGGKILELLKEIVPKLTRVAILRGTGGSNELFVKETEVPARALKIELISVVARGPEDLEDAFRAITKERANGLLARLQGFDSAYLKRVAELAIKNRLPAVGTADGWVAAGGLMSYGADVNVQYRRAAVYVDKILKGRTPAELPIEAPMKFEFEINLQTAKQIGLTIPQTVLFRATKVIKEKNSKE
jgi:putative ABC transport system substrate-binding protein